MHRNASILARRAVHQYRRRDIFSYLGLRLYLANTAAVADKWAREVAVNLVLRRDKPGYIKVDAFKEKPALDFFYRTMYLPAATEIIAETALIDACSGAGGKFASLPCVFSYLMPDTHDACGVYKPYFTGFAERHNGIAEAARKWPTGWVVYLDLRKFYPSISLERARAVWIDACSSSRLDELYRSLGLKLIADYAQATETLVPNKMLVTGPMFCHLIGNLVLRELDNLMLSHSEIAYFRYVDDLALVGPSDAVKTVEKDISKWCASYGLELNNQKRMAVTCGEWLKGAEDFGNDPNSEMWAALIGGIKRLLLADPGNKDELSRLFQQAGIRIPLLDYSKTAREATFIRRLRELSKQFWFRWKGREEGSLSMVGLAIKMRLSLFTELEEKLEGLNEVTPYERKRRIYRLRFLLSRLIYLAEPRQFSVVRDWVAGVPELIVFKAIFNALDTREINDLLNYGATVAHVVAQSVSTTNIELSCSRVNWDSIAAIQAWSVFAAYGIPVSGMRPPRLGIVEVCDWNAGSVELMRSTDMYLQEVACLHGASMKRRHDELLQSAFDTEDNVAFDLADLVAGSY